MAGFLKISSDGISITTIVLDAVEADIDLVTRLNAKALAYTGDADNDAMPTTTRLP